MNNNKSSILSNFLWYCAASDPEVLRNNCTKSTQRWHRILGTFIFITTMAAFYSGYKAFGYIITSVQEVNQNDIMLIIGPLAAGLIWALVVFNVDRLLIASIQKSAIQFKYKDETNKWKYFFGRVWDSAIYFSGLALRIVIGVAISVSISFIVEMSIFEPQIEAYLNGEYKYDLVKKNKGQSNVAVDSTSLVSSQNTEITIKSDLDINKRYIDNINSHPEVQPLFVDYTAKNLEYRTASQNLTDFNIEYNAKENELLNDYKYFEILDSNKILNESGKIEFAPFVRRKRDLEATKRRKRTVRNDKKTTYDNKIELVKPRLEDERSTLSTTLSTVQSDITDIDQRIGLKTKEAEDNANLATIGFGAKASAFQKLRSSDKDDNKGINMIAYGLLFIFLLIELLPILTKYFGSTSSYDDNVYVNDQILKKAAALKLKTATEFFDSSQNEDLDG